MNEVYLYIIFIIFIFSILIFYKYQDRYYELINKIKNEEFDIDSYFFKDVTHLKRSTKRKIWIHLPIEKNSRKWLSFNSRSSTDLNLDYMALCIKSIIDYCGQHYDIVLFDDSNLNMLLPEHNVDYTILSGNTLEKYRQHSILNILYNYGGIVMPNSIFMSKSIYHLDKFNTFYVTEMPNQGLNSTMNDFVYSTQLMGSNSHNPILLEYIHKYSSSCLKDLTNESYYFSDQLLKQMDIPILNGKMIGVKDINDNKVILEDLLDTKMIQFDKSHIGVYIPHNELMRRTKYNWFACLNAEQLLETNLFITKYMLSHNKTNI